MNSSSVIIERIIYTNPLLVLEKFCYMYSFHGDTE